MLNAYAGEVVKHEFRNKYKTSIKFTVSQIVLNWINNENIPWKQWVCNQIVEIRRLGALLQRKYNNTSDMIANTGTRKGDKTSDVDTTFSQINGYQWMKQQKEFC